ncbi:sensor domain-containing diguanylate cyclase [Thiohalophilus thiocyanatoxydans]|uniref:diguanylate cyclase n=1 Tax=Thiohalophilus thiocyanatoxydans TaxID=381308 RepID=A0A4V3H424_9GAMM|nr:sensor domain-containing diguanylate cyclase [Thiohalophilus thiocyanatoxydans]TDY01565.1 diguanylate cyclase (GGDEF)-like protein [Thiohalophilus thiocyanatoxydans]
MSELNDNKLQKALESCAREPVHIPGAIQPQGCLISMDDTFSRILQVSANINHCLAVSPEQALQSSPQQLLGKQLIQRLQRALKDAPFSTTALRTTRRFDEQTRRYNVLAYRSGKRLVLEFEQLHQSSRHRLLPAVNDWLDRFARANDSQALLDTLTQGIRELTGYERVMVYHFDNEWHGSVIAESLGGQADSFLGHHFPASDIPPQVRALYDINPVRSIPDARVTGVPLIPAEDPDNGPLDLSQGILRAVSPIHLAYLQNMDVQGALSIALHNQQQLYGLVAAHALQPRPLPPDVRDAARSLVQAATQRLFLLKAHSEARFLQRVRDSQALISDIRGQLREPATIVQEHGYDWLELFEACGCALVYPKHTIGLGRVPDRPTLQKIVAWLNQESQTHDTWQSHELRHTGLAGLVDKQDACGLLAAPLPLGQKDTGWLLLLRAEHIETRLWAGNPEKPLLDDKEEVRLSPRHSFATWAEQVTGQSRAWSAIEQRAVTGLAEDLAVAVSAHEIAKLNERLEHLAYTDALTGIWNRSRTETVLDSEISAAIRYGRPCSVLLFDIDHFKQVNDTHGHDAGDKVLVTISDILNRSLRPTDHFGRWGGEEFLVIAGNSTLECTLQLAERLRQAIEAGDMGPIGHITASFGVTTWVAGDTRRTLVKRADQAMYRAKEAGRNRVMSETGSGTTSD